MPRPSKSAGKPKVTGKNPGNKKSTASSGWFRPLRWIRFIVLFFLVSSFAAVVLFRFVPPPLTPLMAIRYGLAYTGGAEPKLDKTWKALEKISPRLVEAVIASEDQTFPEHWGFDFDAIASAFSRNEKSKRKLGASTITQQTAKNLFLWPERSWTRKALEAYFTLLLEVVWNKHRILEVYLNIIEMGDGVYGAEAAANKYFGSTAADLDRNQAALLAAILPKPRAWSPDKPSPYLLRRQTWILRQMDHQGPLPEELSYKGGPKTLGHIPVTPRTKASSLAGDTLAPSRDLPPAFNDKTADKTAAIVDKAEKAPNPEAMPDAKPETKPDVKPYSDSDADTDPDPGLPDLPPAPEPSSSGADTPAVP